MSRTAAFFIIIVLATSAAARGQATRPAASRPAIDRTLLDQAAARVKVGEDAQAITLIRKFQASLPTLGMNTSADWVNSNHMLAVAYMDEGDYAKAKAPMEFVMRSGKSNHSIILNSAMLDLDLKQGSVRAVNTLRAYVGQHADDETAVNLLGMALKIAAESFPKADLAAARADYQQANAQLESSKPGMKRWGDQWMKAADFDKLEEKRRATQLLVDQRGALLSQQQDQLAQLQTEYLNVTKPIVGLGRGSAAQQSIAASDLSDRISALQAQVAQTKAAYDQALAELPVPAWHEDLEPMEVEWVK